MTPLSKDSYIPWVYTRADLDAGIIRFKSDKFEVIKLPVNNKEKGNVVN